MPFRRTSVRASKGSGFYLPKAFRVTGSRSTGGPTDPNFSSVSLLLHMDGSNGSTTFTDASSNNFTVSVGGNAQVTTSDPKFGSGCLLVDGSGDYVSTPSDTKFQIGTGDYTVEFWVYVNSGNSNNGVFTFGATSSGLALAVYSGGWHLTFSGAGGDNMGTVTLSTWQHIAITRSGSSNRMFVNGTQIGATLTNATNLADNQLKIGYYYDPYYCLNGKIDEFRFTKGVARYTTNFTAPTAPFPDS